MGAGANGSWAPGRARRDDIFGYVPTGVGRRAIDFGGVLAGEGTATVTAPATVGVDNNLPARQASVTVRAAHYESAGGVDVVGDSAGIKVGWQFRLDDLFNDVALDFFVADMRCMLRGDNNGVDSHRLVAVVFDRHLTLRVGPQPVDVTLQSGVGEPVEDPMRQSDRQWHQFRSVGAGIAEHQSLVTGTDIFACRLVFIDAHGDVAALLADSDQHRAGVSSDAHLVIGVADLTDHITDNLLVVNRAPRGDFTGDHRQAGGDERLAGDTAVGILSEIGVENAVGNLVGQFVRVSHAD